MVTNRSCSFGEIEMTFTKTYYRTEYHDDGYGFSGYADIEVIVPLASDGMEIEDRAIIKVEGLTESDIDRKRDELMAELKKLIPNEDDLDLVMDYCFDTVEMEYASRAEKLALRDDVSEVITDFRFLDAWDQILESVNQISIPELSECGYKWEITDDNGNVVGVCECDSPEHRNRPSITDAIGPNSSVKDRQLGRDTPKV